MEYLIPSGDYSDVYSINDVDKSLKILNVKQKKAMLMHVYIGYNLINLINELGRFEKTFAFSKSEMDINNICLGFMNTYNIINDDLKKQLSLEELSNLYQECDKQLEKYICNYALMNTMDFIKSMRESAEKLNKENIDN